MTHTCTKHGPTEFREFAWGQAYCVKCMDAIVLKALVLPEPDPARSCSIGGNVKGGDSGRRDK